jgi:ElaB/YqjD/DUF883 family membrane-anchored ribosome-binding protein
MAETTDQVRHEADAALRRLEHDVNTLQYRVRQEVDWRYQFERRPWAFVGGAFGLAFLLGLGLSRRRRYYYGQAYR